MATVKSSKSASKSSKSAADKSWNAESIQPLSTVMYFFVDSASGALVSQPGEGVQGFAILLRSYQGGTPKVAVCDMYVAQKAGRESETQDTRKLILTSAAGHSAHGVPQPGNIVIGATAAASWSMPVASTVLGKMAEFAQTLESRRLAA